MIRAHYSPKYKTAPQTILTLLQKYSERVSELASAATVDVSGGEKAEIRVEPKFWANESLSEVLADMKILLERAASNHPLDPLFKTLRACVQDFFGSLVGSGLTEYLLLWKLDRLVPERSEILCLPRRSPEGRRTLR